MLHRAVPPKARRKAQHWLRRYRPAPPPPPPKKAAAAKPPVVSGAVTDYRSGVIEGWVELAEGVESVPVAVRIGEVEAMHTVATPSPHAKAGDRTGHFRFQARGLWQFCGKSDRISVVADGKPLPIMGGGRTAAPAKIGKRTTAELVELLAAGQVFSRWGDLQVVKSQDTRWIDAVLDLYDAVAEVLRSEFDYEAFVIYGSLLGTTREGGVIGVDDDADMAFVSRLSEGPALAKEMRDIGARLLETGLQVTLVSTNMYVWNPAQPEVRIDLFHLYWDSKDVLAFPFGVAGTRDVTRSQWKGVADAPFCHRTVGAPVVAEDVVAAMYGETWRTPNSGFNWKKDRRTAGYAGRIPADVYGPFNWEDHYARVEIAEPSTFATSLLARPDLPARVVDLGSGCGRDSLAFVAAGRSVLGLDRSGRAVARAVARVPEARFEVVEFGAGEWVAAVREWIAAGEGPVLFHARFLFHALNDEAHEAVLAGVAELSRPGDLLAAEFRTAEDEALPKNSPKMFRRFLDAPAFDADLAENRGFEILETADGRGLAWLEKDDPALHRVVARRR